MTWGSVSCSNLLTLPTASSGSGLAYSCVMRARVNLVRFSIRATRPLNHQKRPPTVADGRFGEAGKAPLRVLQSSRVYRRGLGNEQVSVSKTGLLAPIPAQDTGMTDSRDLCHRGKDPTSRAPVCGSPC